MHKDVGEHAEGRVMHPAAVFQFAFGEGSVVMRAGGKDCIVVGIVGLHNDTAGQIAAASAA